MSRVAGVDQIKGRYIVGLLLLSILVLPALFGPFWASDETPWYWLELGFVYPMHLVDLAFILIAGRLVRLDFRALFGPLPTPADWRLLLHVDLFLYGMASALLFAIYLPLSYLSPEYVSWWLDWSFSPSVYLDDDGSLPLLANLMGWVSLAVLAPVIEELLFRGFLLHRWAVKWGVARAIIASSALFGVLHPDPVGAALFGAGMCLLYLHTRTLWVPIIAHAIYNGFIWSQELYGVLDQGADYYLYDLALFRSEWWYGAAGAVVALAAAVPFLRRRTAEPVR
jgi:membrane protease YdiL (CAAX protease family)